MLYSRQLKILTLLSRFNNSVSVLQMPNFQDLAFVVQVTYAEDLYLSPCRDTRTKPHSQSKFPHRVELPAPSLKAKSSATCRFHGYCAQFLSVGILYFQSCIYKSRLAPLKPWIILLFDKPPLAEDEVPLLPSAFRHLGARQ